MTVNGPRLKGTRLLRCALTADSAKSERKDSAAAYHLGSLLGAAVDGHAIVELAASP